MKIRISWVFFRPTSPLWVTVTAFVNQNTLPTSSLKTCCVQSRLLASQFKTLVRYVGVNDRQNYGYWKLQDRELSKNHHYRKNYLSYTPTVRAILEDHWLRGQVQDITVWWALSAGGMAVEWPSTRVFLQGSPRFYFIITITDDDDFF